MAFSSSVSSETLEFDAGPEFDAGIELDVCATKLPLGMELVPGVGSSKGMIPLPSPASFQCPAVVSTSSPFRAQRSLPVLSIVAR